MLNETRTTRRSRDVLVAAVVLLAVVALGWLVIRAAGGPRFSDDPQAVNVAFAREHSGGSPVMSVLIYYHRCSERDLIPYVDAAEAIGDDEREWEVVAEQSSSDKASWIARRHPTGEEEPPPEPFDEPLPPANDVRLNVHVYSASIENRWHVRVSGLIGSDLPRAAIGSFDVVTADGKTMSRIEWERRADETC